MSFSISGKTAIVTGGAQGIGLAIGRHFADKGANVMLADMDEKQLKKEFGDANDNDNLRYFAGDLRERLTLNNLLSATLDAFDQVDILVNASRQVMTTNPMDLDDNSVETALEQNLFPAMRLSQLVGNRMIKQAKDQSDGSAGSIINLSSITTKHAHRDLMGFSVSIAALDQMTRTMAAALAPHRVRVNGLAFGSVMSAALKEYLKDHPDCRDEIECATPMGRIAAPIELVETAQYLASDASGFVTGQIMVVDGGRSLFDPVRSGKH